MASKGRPLGNLKGRKKIKATAFKRKIKSWGGGAGVKSPCVMRFNRELIFNIKPYYNVKLEKVAPLQKTSTHKKISSTSDLKLLNNSL